MKFKYIKFILQFNIYFLVTNSQKININDGLNAFAINLLATTNSEGGESLNLALSPYTVWTLLSIIAEGAQGNTANQLETVLNVPHNKQQFRNDFRNLSNILQKNSEGVNLEISNAIFTRADQRLRLSFESTSQQYYGVNIQSTDFKNQVSAKNKINSYVEKITKNRIRNFITSDDIKDAQIFMTSIMFFKGQWKLPFNKSATYKDTFYDEKRKEKGPINMMYQMGFFPYSRIEEIQSHAVELPYGKGDKMSMVVVLPFKTSNIQTVLNLMANMPFRKVIDILGTAEQEFADEDVQVHLPRFTAKSDLNLNIVLEKMGILDLFNEDKADLLGIFPHYLHVSRLIQRAEIEVNEEGTIASAAAGASFAYKSPPPKFIANRPFLYFLVNKQTGSIIFVGKISNPNALF